MTTIRTTLAGLLSGLLILFTTSGSVGAAPMNGERPAGISGACKTGFRGDPRYDARCLKKGAVLDGWRLWAYSDGERRTAGERREMCRDAAATGDIWRGLTDTMTDPAYDRFRNYRSMARIAAAFGVADCRALGAIRR